MSDFSLSYAVTDFVPPVPTNEFTPFVNDVLGKLPADKSITFAPFENEAAAQSVLTKLQRAASGSPFSVRKAFMGPELDDKDKPTGKTILEVRTAPRPAKDAA